MGVEIHPSAQVEKGAEFGSNVVVEAFCHIGKMAKIGDACVVRHHASVEGNVVLGKENEIFPYALIGGLTHDLKFEGGNPGLEIGDNNIFREYVTAHVATKDQENTKIGSANVFLAYSHIAHDCQLGNQIVMSSHAALGGHVEVADHTNIGWGSGVHQFCRLGKYSMVSACSKLVQDVPPFMLADGSPAEVRSINKVGLDRANFSPEEVDEIKSVFKIFYRSSLNRSQAIEKVTKDFTDASSARINEIIKFVEQSERGIA
jgi:UDP-N-acetylglucosamine acyltransferase